MEERLPSRRVVLLGAGHTNAHILRMWGMQRPADWELVCVSNFPVATYSGMLPAVLAGQVPEAAMEIDLVRLCAAVGATLVIDRFVGLDRIGRQILFSRRAPLSYDVLSIGIGSVPTTAEVEGADRWAIKIKPMQTFLPRLRARLAALHGDTSSTPVDAQRRPGSADRPLQVIVVGGGVAGIEIACCLPHFLRREGMDHVGMTLITRGSVLAEDLAPSTRSHIHRILNRRKIHTLTGAVVTQVEPDGVWLDDGRHVAGDLVIWATGASPPPELERIDLPKDQRGFLLTEPTLQVSSGDPIFVVGDTGSIRGRSVPKAGVYAVRQGPILWRNIQLFLRGEPRIDEGTAASDRAPSTERANHPTAGLKEFQPQRSFLRLINVGDGTAVGQWHRFAFAGRWALHWKLRIDQRFMQKHAAERYAMPRGRVMPCRGCGCKVGATTLRRALSDLSLSRLDDAATIDAGGESPLLASTDFFSLPLPDPFISGKIAAIHACSDLLASGARPSHALLTLVVPEGTATAQHRFLTAVVAGVVQQLQQLGAQLVGGHTVEGPRAEVGLAVLGRGMKRTPLSKGGLQAGDWLFLTKPLGVGVLLAAHMQARCSASYYDALIASMLQPQSDLMQAVVELGVTAATDVTGFGLAGHLLEMLEASRVDATLWLEAIPLLPGACALIAAGMESTLAPANRTASRAIDSTPELKASPKFAGLFDPQTCGGFLIGVPEPLRESFLEMARVLGYQPKCIGRTTPRQGPQARIRLHASGA
ncbi:MAG: hypothetical protein KatS3mg111_3533 [Pirellulaceae bacterium]|nr:MAG: hypothetical protein KatS3mg111_3533 [Pirellulaceae bacterium]